MDNIIDIRLEQQKASADKIMFQEIEKKIVIDGKPETIDYFFLVLAINNVEYYNRVQEREIHNDVIFIEIHNEDGILDWVFSKDLHKEPLFNDFLQYLQNNNTIYENLYSECLYDQGLENEEDCDELLEDLNWTEVCLDRIVVELSGGRSKIFNSIAELTHYHASKVSDLLLLL